MKKPWFLILPLPLKFQLFMVLLIIGSVFLFRDRFIQKEEGLIPAPTPAPTSYFTLPEAKEEEVEVSLTPRHDKKAVILKISKIPSDVISLEYELLYEAKGKQGPLPRGVGPAKIDIKGQETILREIVLGTCSRNVCVYDEGVKKVSLTLKFNKTSGKSTGFAKEYEL